MGTVSKYPRLQIDAVRGAAKPLRARYLQKGLWSSEELIRHQALPISEMPPKKRRGGRPKKKNNFATYNKAQTGGRSSAKGLSEISQ